MEASEFFAALFMIVVGIVAALWFGMWQLLTISLVGLAALAILRK